MRTRGRLVCHVTDLSQGCVAVGEMVPRVVPREARSRKESLPTATETIAQYQILCVGNSDNNVTWAWARLGGLSGTKMQSAGLGSLNRSLPTVSTHTSIGTQ